ncbi:hypothetical protein B7P43_G03140, partial [Cryptotermes secundus]
LTKRSEIIAEVPADEGKDGTERIISKLEIAEGIYIANSLTKIEGNKAITSILNTRDEEVVMEIPLLQWKGTLQIGKIELVMWEAVKHSITVIPGTSPINTRPYRLPEAQKVQVDTQVTKLLQGGIITESKSPWNSPILVIPKREDTSGEKKWRLVVDFRNLNEKSIHR